MPRSEAAMSRSAMSSSLSSTVMPCTRADSMTWAVPSIRTVLPRRKRRDGKSVTMRHFNSPRMPWAPSTWATVKDSGVPLDDVEVDAGAFAGGGGLDEGTESADDAALAADDFADVFFVDFQLVDRGVAIRDLVDLDRIWLIDERLGDVLDQPLEVGFELFEVLLLFQRFLCRAIWRLRLRVYFGHGVLRGRGRARRAGELQGGDD